MFISGLNSYRFWLFSLDFWLFSLDFWLMLFLSTSFSFRFRRIKTFYHLSSMAFDMSPDLL